ncbi:MAG TPA: hypothetical protein PK358_12010 [Spirochaetota bacterium]|nr:hypothetical protein [Spirochaetota bacterium]HPJ35555.1 hypothetical protein [Spirochaetota bacterium]
MEKNNIIIVTGTGGELGTGHLQRMLNLVSYITGKHNFDVSILLQKGEAGIPERFRHMLITSLPPSADLIIRDMRDSSKEEITSLKSIAPVLAVDDAGEGRSSADHYVDLLPNKISGSNEPGFYTEKFIYGYNFTEGIKNLSGADPVSRDIDITIYAGFNPPEELLTKISKSIPESTKAILLSSGRPVVLTGEPLHEDVSYAEILTRSRIVMTHFGITMFEANICGCIISALNPTPYHGELTALIEKEMRIIHSALYSDLDPVILSEDINMNLKKNLAAAVSFNDILERINIGLENFTRYIYKILL